MADLDRRHFLAGAAALALPAAAAGAVPRFVSARPDYRVTIGIVGLELAPGTVVRTIGYNGTVPGPPIRVREGRPVTIEVVNELCGIDDIVHWHGLQVPTAVDGAIEEGGRMIGSNGRHTFSFVAQPAGTRWYHSHAIAKTDLSRGLYSGQFGFFLIEPRDDPGRYDREETIVLHAWQPRWVILQDLRRGPPADNGLEVAFDAASLNGRALGHGPPIRVRQGERVLFRMLNASPTMDVSLALPGHRFTVTALDGNAVPSPQARDTIYLAPGERVDAIVEMNQPGVWILGATQNDMRMMGMGTVVEYAGATGDPVWQTPSAVTWDYTAFGAAPVAREPDGVFTLTFEKIAGGRGGYNRWTINGKSWPYTDALRVQAGKRYRIVMNNASGDMHPIHVHRHRFELTAVAGKPTSGVLKDVVAVPPRKSVEVELIADNPGPSLVHCHMQDHQDFGFMTLLEYV
jgi:FtsP/CotA-like multicopper oxidase with cupredoxin domain